MAANASGSRVRSRACTSARASMWRDTRFCTGCDTACPTAMQEEQQRDHPRVPGPVGAGPAQQRRPGEQPAQQRHAAGRAERARSACRSARRRWRRGPARARRSTRSRVGQPVEHRVVDDDPPGRAEARTRRRSARSCGGRRRRPARPATGVPFSSASASRSLRSSPAGSGWNRLNAGSMSTGHRNDPTTTSAAAAAAPPRPTRCAAPAGRARRGRAAPARSARRRSPSTPRRRAATAPSSRVDSPYRCRTTSP